MALRVLVSLGLVLLASASATASGSPEVRCPVSGLAVQGGPLTPSVSFKDGQQLVFASNDAVCSFLRDPAAAVAGAGSVAAAVAMEAMPMACPVTGKSVQGEPSVASVQMQHGQSVYFCCPKCAAKFRANISAYIVASTCKEAASF